MKKKAIYLDSHATTPVDQDVLSAMLPYFTQHYGNGNHEAGWKANSAIENARNQVSNLIGSKPSEITFTSGATEAINIALLGLAKSNKSKRNHIITLKTEHLAVLQCIEALRQYGYCITMLEVDAVGRVTLEDLIQAISDRTLVVAIMLANNEIGTVQPIKQIGEICKANGAKFFCDITQGLGWHPINMNNLQIDMASMSAHKIYGPRGIGALYIKKTTSGISIDPIQFGGGQERGIRPGTHNVPAIVGFGKACEILNLHSKEIYGNIAKMRDRLQEILCASIKGVILNGCLKERHPANLNISIPNISGEQLKGQLPNIMISTGSACSSGSVKPSHVVAALNTSDSILKNSFRIGVSKYNTISEIDFVGQKIIEIANSL